MKSVIRLPKKEAETYKKMLDELVGTKGAYLLDKGLNVLGKVPYTELFTTIRSLTDIHSIILDGEIEDDAPEYAMFGDSILDEPTYLELNKGDDKKDKDANLKHDNM